MVTEMLVIPKNAYNILQRLTGETRPDAALSAALKDLVRLRMDVADNVIKSFEKKYNSPFIKFESDWKAGKIKDAYSYDVEKDYLAWEAALTDQAALQEIAQWLL